MTLVYQTCESIYVSQNWRQLDPGDPAIVEWRSCGLQFKDYRINLFRFRKPFIAYLGDIEIN